MLKDQGIDLDHNRFLILQGEVEQISLMKPKGTTANEEGLLEYLEDIIGSNRFVAPIAAAATDLEAAVVEHDAALVRTHFAEGELRKLEALKNEAESHFEALMELCDKRATVVRLDQMDADSRSAEARDQEAKLAARLEENVALLKQKEELMADAAAGFKAQNAQMKSAVAEQQEAKEALAEFERKEVSLGEELKHGRENAKKIEAKIKKTEKELREKESVQKLEARLPEYEVTLKKVTASHTVEEQKLEAMYEALKGESTKIHVQLEQRQKEMLPWTKQLNDAQSQLDLAVSEQDMLQKQTGKRSAALSKAQEELRTMDSTLAKQQTALESATATLAGGKSREQELKTHIHRLEEEENRIQGELREVRDKLVASRTEVDSNSGMGKIIRLLGNAADQGLIANFHGRLGDLGTIDPKYDVAVSTAAPGLNNLIIDSEKEAAKCIALMKKKNVGRATFCILDRQKDLAQKCRNKIDTPEGVPRLFDLIRPVDEKFSAAFYHALRDTLVAEDIDQGSRLAYGQRDGRRWRVVTLDGKIIDLAGTMTGGGSRPMMGLMKLQAANDKKAPAAGLGAITKEDVEKLTLEEAAKLKELDRVMNELASANQQLKMLHQDLERCALDVPKIKMQLDSYAGRRAELMRRLPELEKACALSADERRELARLDEEVTSKTAQLKKVRGETAELQAQIDALKQALEGLGGDNVKQQKELVERIAVQVEETSGKISETKVRLSGASKAIPKLEKALAAAQKELEEANADAAKKEDELANLMEKFKSEREVYQSKVDIATKLEMAVKKLSREHEASAKAIAELKSGAVDLRNKLEDLRQSLVSYENNKGKLEQRLAIEARKKHDFWKQCHPNMENDEDAAAAAAAAEGKGKEEADDVVVAVAAENEPFALKVVSAEELAELNKNQLKQEIARLEKATQGENVHNGAIREYLQQAKLVEAKQKEKEVASAVVDKARELHESLRSQRLSIFMEGFSFINSKLKATYQAINMGGDAEMEPRDHMDPFAEGIEFTVKPPKKSWKAIMNLSGGEKTLSSLSLVFALHQYKPTPIYVMDEIDAALDFRNVSIVASYIRERTRNDAQFIVISLRSDMFESAERLHGIYKTNDTTKSVTIDPKAFHLGRQIGGGVEAKAEASRHVVAVADAPLTPVKTVAKKVRSDKGKEEADEDDESSSLREITNA